jgi:hypothetical protein
MSFQDLMASDMDDVFLNSSEFAEEITYTPNGGTAATVTAIVTRTRPGPAGGQEGRSQRASIEIVVSKTTVPTVIKGKDLVVTNDVNGTSRDWIVVDVLDSDTASWHLLCNK